MTEIKPCPFCGGEADVVVDMNYIDWPYTIECDDCGVSTRKSFNGQNKATDLWNARASDKRIARLEEALRDIVQRIKDINNPHDLAQSIIKDIAKQALED